MKQSVEITVLAIGEPSAGGRMFQGIILDPGADKVICTTAIVPTVERATLLARCLCGHGGCVERYYRRLSRFASVHSVAKNVS